MNKTCDLITMYVNNFSNLCKHRNGGECIGYCLKCSKQVCANCKDNHADHSKSILTMKSAMEPIKKRLHTCKTLYSKKEAEERNLFFSLTEEIGKLRSVHLEIREERMKWRQLIGNIKDTFLQQVANHMAKLEEICEEGNKQQSFTKDMINTIDSLENLNSVKTFYPIWLAVIEKLDLIKEVDEIPECGTFSLILHTLPDISCRLVENRVLAVEKEEMYKLVRDLCESILRQFSEEPVELTEALNNLTTIPLIVEYVQNQTSINQKTMLEERERLRKKARDLEKKIYDMKGFSKKQKNMLEESANVQNELETEINEIKIKQKTVLEERAQLQSKVEEFEKQIKEIKTSYGNLSTEKEKLGVELQRIKSENEDKESVIKDKKADVCKSLNILHESVMQIQTDEDRAHTVSNIETGAKSEQAVVDFVLKHIFDMNQKLIKLKSDLNDEIAKRTDLTNEGASAIEAAKNNITIFKNELEFTKIQLEQLSNSNVTLNQQVKDSEEQCFRVKQENNQTAVQFKDLSKERDVLKSRIESLTQKLIEKENEVASMSAAVKNMSSLVIEKESDIARIQQDRDKSVYSTNQLYSQLDQKNKFIAQQKEIIHKQEDAITAFKKEKDDLQTRLSSVAGEKLTKGNPSITDLGDPNRPMKISEKYGELYDNEWTDAMDNNTAVKEYYHGLNDSEIEEIIICHLHRLLKCCYKECLAKADEQIQTLGKAFAETMCLTFDSKEEVISLPVCKEASVFRRAKSVDFAKFLLKNEILCRNVMDDWNYNYKNEKVMQLLMTSSFFEKCVHICWSMTIQDPVMYLDEDVPADTQIDKNTYKEFVKSGNTVAFVVWPALFLHKDGPLLYKGVVHAYWK
ncbi:GOLGB1 [Mytilus coruscus]|uniref:GOLGB1 n=1 Tax=Mytilus coruscus TaxID=42192 RepID=A0A6J8E8B9_MYTCO|nr:GOLGB1 [Mytilus coruscus]